MKCPKCEKELKNKGISATLKYYIWSCNNCQGMFLEKKMEE